MSARRWKETIAARFDKAVVRDPLTRTLFEITFDQENRLRVLESRPAITRAQAMATLKSKYLG